MARPKGSRNSLKATLLSRLDKEFPEYHPVVEMARIANDPDVPLEQRFAAHKEVAKYVTPQLKAIAHMGEGGGPLQHVISSQPMTLEEWEAAQKEPEGGQ